MFYNSTYKLFADSESSVSTAIAKPMSAELGIVVGLPIPGPKTFGIVPAVNAYAAILERDDSSPITAWNRWNFAPIL